MPSNHEETLDLLKYMLVELDCEWVIASAYESLYDNPERDSSSAKEMCLELVDMIRSHTVDINKMLVDAYGKISSIEHSDAQFIRSLELVDDEDESSISINSRNADSIMSYTMDLARLLDELRSSIETQGPSYGFER